MIVDAVVVVLAAGLDPDTIGRWVETGGVFVLFGLLFACGLGLPLPEDIPLILGGIGIAFWGFDPVAVAVACWTGIIGGDVSLYWIARRYGHNVSRLPVIGRHVNERRLAWVEDKFARYGIWVVAVGRLFAGVRGAMVVAAGTIRFNFAKFLAADGLAALISGGLFVWLGYWGGQKIFADVEHAKRYTTYALIGLVLVGVGYYVHRRRRRTWIANREAATAPVEG